MTTRAARSSRRGGARARCGSEAPILRPETTAAALGRALPRIARAVLAAAPALSVAELRFDGRDLIRMGLRPGPDFGRILDDLLDFVLEDPARNRADVLEGRVGAIAEGGDG